MTAPLPVVRLRYDDGDIVAGDEVEPIIFHDENVNEHNHNHNHNQFREGEEEDRRRGGGIQEIKEEEEQEHKQAESEIRERKSVKTGTNTHTNPNSVEMGALSASSGDDEEGVGRTSTLALSDSAHITFRDIKFTVTVKDPTGKSNQTTTKEVLKGITGHFRPNRFTAIMGASGAGKTSLLNCLAGYATTGITTGNVLINSTPVTSTGAMKRISAYVFQDDIIMSSQTVREAITMAAMLKLPADAPITVKEQRVDEIINVLHLTKAQHSMIGSERVKGISGGERRRTSLGMQMVTNPSILYLDEPTSGLDTFTAYSVCKILKSVANRHGKTVVATIHQPSSDIFHMFDDLILMADGHIVYHGPASLAMPYFAQRGYPCPVHHNPSDHFFNSVLHDNPVEEEHAHANGRSLESSSDHTSSSAGLLTASSSSKLATSADALAATEQADRKDEERHAWLISQWNSSSEQAALVRECASPPSGAAPTSSSSSMAPFSTQFSQLALRASRNMVRDPLILKARFGQTIVFGVMVGLLYLNVVNTQQGIQNRLGALFFVAVQMLFGGSMSIMTIFGAEKGVFLREHSAGLYGLPAYFISRNCVEVPVKLIFPFLFGTLSYWMVGFQYDGLKYLAFIVTLILVDSTGGSLGLFLATLFPDIRVAMAIMPAILLPLMIFSGFFINSSSYPVYLGWIEYISPMKYGFVALVKGEFTGLHLSCLPNELKNSTSGLECPVTTGEQEISILGFDTQPNQSLCMLYLFLMFIGLVGFSYAALRNSIRVMGTAKDIAPSIE